MILLACIGLSIAKWSATASVPAQLWGKIEDKNTDRWNIVSSPKCGSIIYIISYDIYLLRVLVCLVDLPSADCLCAQPFQACRLRATQSSTPFH